MILASEWGKTVVPVPGTKDPRYMIRLPKHLDGAIWWRRYSPKYMTLSFHYSLISSSQDGIFSNPENIGVPECKITKRTFVAEIIKKEKEGRVSV